VAELKTEEAQLFMDPNYAVASTVRPDGCPQQTVVWVDYDGENVVFNTAEGRAKPKYLRRAPRAGIHVTHPEDPYKWVSVSGPVELTHEGADEHIDKLAKKYLGVDSYPGRKEGEQRVIVRIKPEHVNSSGLDGR
jgi:PPOX class probable F420-dependent enzyme